MAVKLFYLNYLFINWNFRKKQMLDDDLNNLNEI